MLVEDLLKHNIALPEVFVAIGTEDFLLENARDFHAYLEKMHVAHHYYESKGSHDMAFWDEYARKLVPLLFDDAEEDKQ